MRKTRDELRQDAALVMLKEELRAGVGWEEIDWPILWSFAGEFAAAEPEGEENKAVCANCGFPGEAHDPSFPSRSGGPCFNYHQPNQAAKPAEEE